MLWFDLADIQKLNVEGINNYITQHNLLYESVWLLGFGLADIQKLNVEGINNYIT